MGKGSTLGYHGATRWRNKVQLSGGGDEAGVIAGLKAAAACADVSDEACDNVVDLFNPDFKVDASERTVYHNQVFKFDGSDGNGAQAMAGRTVIGLRGVVIGANKKYVHHFTLSGVNTATDLTEMLYAWAPGSQPLVFPDNVGINLANYDAMKIQTHFDNPGLVKGVVDTSGVKFYLAPANQPREMDYGVLQLGDPNVNFGDRKVFSGSNPFAMYKFECPNLKASKPITLFAHGLHMHGSGARMLTQHFRAGQCECTPVHVCKTLSRGMVVG